jgi:lipoic acid synthetase
MTLEKPSWLRKRLPITTMVDSMSNEMSESRLHTICQEAACPNQGECFSKGVATFLIMGNICTRNCRFCAVTSGKPDPLDDQEAQRVVYEIQKLGLRFVVITSVTRDDLPDGGARYFSDMIQLIRKECKGVKIEILIPDFKGVKSSIDHVVLSAPEVLNHNVETIPRLYPNVRPEGDYNRSLELIKRVKDKDSAIITKSGLMVGLGESKKEVISVLHDLHKARCDTLTIGQYLCPSKKHYPVSEYIKPQIFDEYKEVALKIGFKSVVSSPFARSSFMAKTSYNIAKEVNLASISNSCNSIQ